MNNVADSLMNITNIICKAKSMDTGKWVRGYYVAIPEEYGHGQLCHAIFDPDECEHICMGEYKDYGWHEVDPFTICRCTGVKDKCNNLIFEHDILHGTIYHMFEDIGTFEVHWDDDVGGWNIQCFESSECEIIGNKFDNTGAESNE